MKPITQIDMFGRKECSLCRKLLPLELFVSDPRKAQGVTSDCKECRAARSRRYNRKHRDKMAERRAKPEARAYARAWWAKHKERVSEARREKMKTPEARAKNAQTQREYRKRSVQHRVKMNLRSRVNLAIAGGKKSAQTVELLGCSVPDFLKHLEAQWQPGMGWENYGKGVGSWNVDHIVPCASFDLTDPEEQRRCFHFSNCRPMWALDNCSKGAKPPEELKSVAAQRGR